MSAQKKFAVALRELRVEAGISQEELAHRCGLHRTEISLLERGQRDPRLTTIERLAGGLGVPIARLVEGS
jgi:transcriptional regulator with XRE-family HTH domain